MSHKSRTEILRIGLLNKKDNTSVMSENVWFATSKKYYSDYVINYINAVKIVEKELPKNLYSSCSISANSSTNVVVTIHTHKTSVVGTKVEEIRDKVSSTLNSKELIEISPQNLSRKTDIKKKYIDVKIKNIEHPEADPVIISRRVGELLEKRKPTNLAIKNLMLSALNFSKGIYIQIKGRINGVDIAKKKTYMKGTITRQTFKANVKMHVEHVSTKSGKCSVRVLTQG